MPIHDEGPTDKSLHDFPLLGLRATLLLVHLDLSSVWIDATQGRKSWRVLVNHGSESRLANQ
jgi:hypothetical protein